MKPFADTIRLIRSGAFDELAASELNELVKAVVKSGRKGEMTVKLVVSTNGDQIAIDASTSRKMPAADKVGTAIFFADEEGDLHRQDPRQREMSFVGGNEQRERA